MTKNIEYEFYGGENMTSVDRVKQIVTMNERSGWGRSYEITFQELLDNAKEWDVKVDLNDCDAVIAEVATNIILANNATLHGLDPFRFIPRTNKITDPHDRETLKNFEALLDKYTGQQVISQLSENKKEFLKKLLLSPPKTKLKK